MGNAKVDQELLKLGIAGIICVVLVWALLKSEKREEKKDLRIQMLENQLRESYDERVSAADRLGGAIHESAMASNNAANALQTLTAELKELKAKSHG